MFEHEDFKCLILNYTNTGDFHPLEVVGRYRDPQLQVGENSNYLTWRLKG